MDTTKNDAITEPTVPHEAARPMKVVVARDGNTWLCDAGADESRDLKDQGCWRCEDVPFTRND